METQHIENLPAILEYLKIQCGKLTSAQIAMVKYHLKNGTFYGVARQLHSAAYYPLVFLGKKKPNIITSSGHYDFCSMDRYNYPSGPISLDKFRLSI